MRTKLLAGLGGAALLMTLAACGGDGGSASGDGDDYPSQDMDWTIAFGPGGGNDIMARSMAEILNQYDMYPHDLVLTNREGGSGATGWGYLLGQSGSGYGISTTSGSYITTPLQADTGWTYEDFTPVGLFATDDAYFAVPGDSEFQTWQDWVDYAKAEGPVVVGGIGTVNVDFILHELLAEAAGYEMEYVSFNEEGQLQTALFSGSLDAMVSNTGSLLGQIEAGEVIPLIYTGKERLAVLPDVPTAEEEGLGEMPAMPRGMILPPDAPQEAQDWWIETMQEVVETPEWQEYIDSNYLTENVLWGDEFTEHLGGVVADFEEILQEAGAL